MGRGRGRPARHASRTADGKVQIWRYPNRRLYHPVRRCYINAADAVNAGDPFVVIDSQTGEDLTAATIATAQAHAVRAKHKRGASVVYFVRSGGDGPIKIGLSTSDQVESRIGTLQTGNPCRLSLLGVVEGNRDAEQFLHRVFARHHVGGEWFAPAPDLIAFITETIARGTSIAREEDAQPVQLRLVGSP